MTPMFKPAPKHKNKDEVWRAFTMLCAVADYNSQEQKQACIPAMNVLLGMLRELGEPVGPDYPDTAPKF